MTRLEANREIIVLLADAVAKNPEWRFGQLLHNMDILHASTDEFYVESIAHLERLEAAIRVMPLPATHVKLGSFRQDVRLPTTEGLAKARELLAMGRVRKKKVTKK